MCGKVENELEPLELPADFALLIACPCCKYIPIPIPRFIRPVGPTRPKCVLFWQQSAGQCKQCKL